MVHHIEWLGVCAHSGVGKDDTMEAQQVDMGLEMGVFVLHSFYANPVEGVERGQTNRWKEKTGQEAGVGGLGDLWGNQKRQLHYQTRPSAPCQLGLALLGGKLVKWRRTMKG